MYREVRRKDRQITAEEARSILEKGEYGVMATVGLDGQPYGVPLSYVVVDDAVCFHCAVTGQKNDNMENTPQVSFTVVGGGIKAAYDGSFGTTYESALVYGKAIKVEEPAEKTNILMKLCEKYLPDYMDKAMDSVNKDFNRTAVYKIPIDHITGKSRRS